MITKNPMQLKAIIKNKAKQSNITAQAALQTYCLERLLERISISETVLADYKNVIESLKSDDFQHEYWNRYKAKTPFVKGILYEQTLKAVEDCFIKLIQN